MKSILILLAFTVPFFSNIGLTQEVKAEKVYSIVKVYKTYEWYTQQYNLWEKALKKNKRNAEAWENTYAAARMAKIMSPSDSLRNSWLEKMESTIDKMEKAIPNTYEYYHLKAWNSSIWGTSKAEVDKIISWSEKAYKMDPERTEIYPDIMNVHMMKGSDSEAAEFSKQWLASGDLSPNLMAMTYNMLMSTEENAILLTCGDNDTYPALALQHGQGLRTDVTVINIFCAWGSRTYRSRMFEQCGVPVAESEIFQSEIDIVKHVINNQDERPIYFAYGDYLNGEEELKGKTYNVGLAIRYCDTDYNNTSVLLHNFENKFLMDQLKFDLYQEQFPEQVKRHNLSYIPGLMILYDHYEVMGDVQKQANTKALIQRIVSKTSYEETINAKFNKTD